MFNGNAKDFIMQGPSGTKMESDTIAGLRNSIRSGEVFFYPSYGIVDWDVIKEVSIKYRCKTFICGNWNSTIERVGQAMLHVPMENRALNSLRCDWKPAKDLPLHRLVPRPLLRNPRFLRPEEREPYKISFENDANRQPWCRVVPTIHMVEGQDRALNLIYLSVEGVNAYWKLFNRQRTAPKYLCIKNCGDGFGGNYTAYYRWREALGRAVLAGWDKHGHAPEFLITDREDHDWPWSEVVDHVPGATVYIRPKGLSCRPRQQDATIPPAS